MMSTTDRLSNERALREVYRRCSGLYRPPPKLTVSEWADDYRLIGEANAHPGPWRTDLVPYQREPMDCMGDPHTRRVSLMWGAQLGKTEIENNAIGFYISQDPQSVMMMHPTQSDLKTWVETKLTPLLIDTPVVRDRVAKPRSRDGVNNQNMKSYPGGWLMFAWSGSPNTMRGRSAPKIVCDEIDGYTMTPEGDPVNLLWQRAATFGDQRKLIESSTPTLKGFSRIEKAFEAGDKRRYWLACPHCGERQILKWGQVQWEKEDGEHLPETAVYVCEHCEKHIEDSHKAAMLRDGEWRAEKPFRGHASFHLNELYSPFRRWRDIVESFLEKKRAGDLQTFVNVSLAETWEEDGEKIDDTGLMARREEYTAPVPDGGLVLTCGVDVQPDRLECEVVAWGHDEQSWSVDYNILYGDPDLPEVWEHLDDYLSQRWEHETGIELSITSTAVDTGGSNTQAVYTYCRKRKGQRVFAIKGKGGEGIPIVGSPTQRKVGKRTSRKVALFSLGVDQAKSLLYKRLPLEGEGPGRCHFPKHYQDEYFRMLTAEKCVTRYVKGFPKREWQKIRPRNEALDCRVYAYAALLIIGPNMRRIEKRLKAKFEALPESTNKEIKTKAERVNAPAISAKDAKPKERQKKKKRKKKTRRRKKRGFATNW